MIQKCELLDHVKIRPEDLVSQPLITSRQHHVRNFITGWLGMPFRRSPRSVGEEPEQVEGDLVAALLQETRNAFGKRLGEMPECPPDQACTSI